MIGQTLKAGICGTIGTGCSLYAYKNSTKIINHLKAIQPLTKVKLVKSTFLACSAGYLGVKCITATAKTITQALQ